MSYFTIFPDSRGSIVPGSSSPENKVFTGEELPLGTMDEGTLFYKTVNPNSGLYMYQDGWKQTSSENSSIISFKTGSEITFDKNSVWNTLENPTSGDITQNLITPQPNTGTKQIIYHSSATIPSIPSTWKKLEISEDYSTTDVNIINVNYTNDTNITYSISNILEPFTAEIQVTTTPVVIPGLVGGTGNSYTIDWGDTTITTNFDEHLYNVPGLYKIRITGTVYSLDFSNLPITKVYGKLPLNVSYISFENCIELISVDTSSLTTLKDCNNSWKGCTSLTTFDTRGLTSVTSCDSAWEGCTNLTTFDTSGLTSVVKCLRAWFFCRSLISFDTKGLTSVVDCTSAWENCTSLDFCDTNGLISVVNCSRAWFNCSLTTPPSTEALTSVVDCSFAWNSCKFETFNSDGLISVTNCSGAWRFCGQLVSFNTTRLTSVTNCANAWSNCVRLTSFNAIGLTSVTNCSYAWYNTTTLPSISNLTSLTSVTNCLRAWQYCYELDSFDTSGLTSVTNCANAWEYCDSLTSFDASGLTSVTNCSYAWHSCTGLTSFNALGLISVTDCGLAWSGCVQLTSFDVSSLTKVTDCRYAWENCEALVTVINNAYPQALNERILINDDPNAFLNAFINVPGKPSPFPYKEYKTSASAGPEVNISFNTDASWWSANDSLILYKDTETVPRKLYLDIGSPPVSSATAVAGTEQNVFFINENSTAIDFNATGPVGSNILVVNSAGGQISQYNGYMAKITYTPPNTAICEVIRTFEGTS